MRWAFSAALVSVLSACGGSGSTDNNETYSNQEKPELSPLSTTVAGETSPEIEAAQLYFLNANTYVSATQQSTPVSQVDQNASINAPLEDIVAELGGLQFHLAEESNQYFLEAWDGGSQISASALSRVVGHSIGVVALSDSSEILNIGEYIPYECPVGALCKPTPFAYLNSKVALTWLDVADPADPFVSASLEIDGHYLASQVFGNKLVVLSHYVPQVITTFEWAYASDLERSELLQASELPNLSAGIYESGELQGFLNQGCFAELEPESFILGNTFNITLVDLDSKMISHNTCVSSELSAIEMLQGSIFITLKSGDEHQFEISETRVDYIGTTP